MQLYLDAAMGVFNADAIIKRTAIVNLALGALGASLAFGASEGITKVGPFGIPAGFRN